MGEAGAVVADLGEDPGAGQLCEAGQVMMAASGCWAKRSAVAVASCSALAQAVSSWRSRACGVPKLGYGR
jgi:hypothetical protein